MTFLAFFLVIAVCVLIHEFGHFASARLIGVRVHEFAFGMGPVLLSRERGRTRWSFRAFPVGGFVRLAGMGEEQEGESCADEESFGHKRPWERCVILASGAGLNILLAVGLTAALLMGHGVLDLESTVVGEVMAGYPADRWGVVSGDRILSVNSEAVTTWDDMSRRLREKGARGAVTLEVEHRGAVRVFSGELSRDARQGTPLFGVRPRWVTYGFAAALGHSFSYTWQMSREILSGMVAWIFARRDIDVTGPVGIANLAGEAARQGMWSFLSFLAVINLHLGLLNLFPFPALDGGRLFFVFGEMITGRRLPERWEQYIHLGGFAVLMALILVITWQDLVKLLG